MHESVKYVMKSEKPWNKRKIKANNTAKSTATAFELGQSHLSMFRLTTLHNVVQTVHSLT